MITLDVFKNDAFSVMSLTGAINKIPYVPSRISKLGIFEEEPITTTVLAVEEQGGSLSLIPSVLRGAPANQNKHGKGTVRNFSVPHLPLEDNIRADEVAGLRSLGGTELQSVQTVVNTRMAEMAGKHDATLEYGRIGALKGTILDADGSTVLYNLFTEFGVTQTTVDFDLGTSHGAMKSKILAVIRAIETELGMATYQRVHCFAGPTWFERFIQHPDVKAAYDKFQDGIFLRQDNRSGFEFCGVWFEEYRGKVGTVSFVADSEAHFFPIGVPGLFKTYFAPADFVETVNTPGLPRYAKQELAKWGRAVDIHTQSNPLSLCRRPKVLVKGTTGT